MLVGGAALALGCPPRPAGVERRPGAVLAPADYRLEGCQLVPDPAATVETRTECYQQTSYRPVAAVDTCPAGQDLEHGLCYPRCRAGYTGDGPVCWRDCPGGYRDDGVTCRRDLSIVRAARHGCPWYDACGLGKGRGCTTCPAGYRNDGCTCVRDLDVIAQEAYGRGVGSIPGCRADHERFGLLCYGACPAGSSPDGVMCVAAQATCVVVPVQPWTPLPTYCVSLRGPSFCSVAEVQADTEANARALAACRVCVDCEVEVIACGVRDQVCR